MVTCLLRRESPIGQFEQLALAPPTLADDMKELDLEK